MFSVYGDMQVLFGFTGGGIVAYPPFHISESAPGVVFAPNSIIIHMIHGIVELKHNNDLVLMDVVSDYIA